MITYNSDNNNDNWLLQCLNSFFLFVIIMTTILCCQGCTTAKPVILERVFHDTVHVDRLHLDSVLLHDSVYFETVTHGDTIYRTKEVTRFRDRVSVRRDTVFVFRSGHTDVPVPQERKATFWEKLISPGSLVIFLVYVFTSTLVWLYHRKR